MAAEQRWARSSGAARDVDPMDRFICPICLEVYQDPVRVTCGHTFCSTCLQQCMKQKSPICAVCRSALSPSRKASDLERQMRDILATCKGCHLQAPVLLIKNIFHRRTPLIPGQNNQPSLAVEKHSNFSAHTLCCRALEMALANMRGHSATCSKYESYVMEGIKSVKKEQSQVASDVPNRFTFVCPYCRQQNLDQEGLVEHCNKFHFSDPTPVVCPICASMPWGDAGYRSANFMEHIHRRHRFSYDTFVDYSADEDAMMREALVRSMTDN